jgi:hypothetical protein
LKYLDGDVVILFDDLGGRWFKEFGICDKNLSLEELGMRRRSSMGEKC